MKWIKKGLIYVPNNQVQYMNSHAAIPFAEIIDKNIVRIYFSSRNKLGQSLPYYLDVNANNMKEITNIHIDPLFELGELGTFDDNGIMPSCIVKKDDKKYLYYIGWNPQVTVSYRLSIGLAVTDYKGEVFKKYSKGPICDRSIYEPFFNTAPYIIIEGNKWRMWYISCTEWRIINNYPEPKYHVKYAESYNGIDWIKNGIICIDYDDSSEAIGRPCVIKEDGKYKMWYSYRKLLNYRNSKNNSYRIGYAESSDGIKWKRKDSFVGIEASEQGWDSEMIEYCHVIDINGKKHMIYNGNGFGASGFGYAILE
ncbi:MAG: hypothetical protein ACFFC3_16915 [Candidatus Odinarchaeota archaeon]